MMPPIIAQIDEAASYIRDRWSECPRVGIILGSGLGTVGDAIELGAEVDYGDVPHFLKSTAVGHRGRLLCGRLDGIPIIAMQGRFHAYEGYEAERIAFPIRVMKTLGVELLIVSNAAGGLNPTCSVGDIMVIDDHVNFMNRNPLIGLNDDRLGPRFPDMSAPYDRTLGDRALAIAREHNFPCHRGTYIGVLGPNYETRAEIRMLRNWGDAVGMSTVPEVIAAVHANLRLFGLSTITNICSPDIQTIAGHAEVIAAARIAGTHILSIIRGVLSDLSD